MRADEKRAAVALGHRNVVCPYCHGRGYMAHDDPNTPTGTVRKPCECLPTRRMWEPVAGGPPLSDKRMREYIAAHRGHQATT